MPRHLLSKYMAVLLGRNYRRTSFKHAFLRRTVTIVVWRTLRWRMPRTKNTACTKYHRHCTSGSNLPCHLRAKYFVAYAEPDSSSRGSGSFAPLKPTHHSTKPIKDLESYCRERATKFLKSLQIKTTTNKIRLYRVKEKSRSSTRSGRIDKRR